MDSILLIPLGQEATLAKAHRRCRPLSRECNSNVTVSRFPCMDLLWIRYCGCKLDVHSDACSDVVINSPDCTVFNSSASRCIPVYTVVQLVTYDCSWMGLTYSRNEHIGVLFYHEDGLKPRPSYLNHCMFSGLAKDMGRHAISGIIGPVVSNKICKLLYLIHTWYIRT